MQARYLFKTLTLETWFVGVGMLPLKATLFGGNLVLFTVQPPSKFCREFRNGDFRYIIVTENCLPLVQFFS